MISHIVKSCVIAWFPVVNNTDAYTVSSREGYSWQRLVASFNFVGIKCDNFQLSYVCGGGGVQNMREFLTKESLTARYRLCNC